MNFRVISLQKFKLVESLHIIHTLCEPIFKLASAWKEMALFLLFSKILHNDMIV